MTGTMSSRLMTESVDWKSNREFRQSTVYTGSRLMCVPEWLSVDWVLGPVD